MHKFSNKIAFVVATKDRPNELRTMLESLSRQTRLPDRVVIVDSSGAPDEAIASEFPSMPVKYIRYTEKPSASGQRNFGLSAVDEGIDLIGFLDDDTEFEPDSLEKMMAFWESAPDDGGQTEIVNHPALLYGSVEDGVHRIERILENNEMRAELRRSTLQNS